MDKPSVWASEQAKGTNLLAGLVALLARVLKPLEQVVRRLRSLLLQPLSLSPQPVHLRLALLVACVQV